MVTIRQSVICSYDCSTLPEEYEQPWIIMDPQPGTSSGTASSDGDILSINTMLADPGTEEYGFMRYEADIASLAETSATMRVRITNNTTTAYTYLQLAIADGVKAATIWTTASLTDGKIVIAGVPSHAFSDPGVIDWYDWNNIKLEFDRSSKDESNWIARAYVNNEVVATLPYSSLSDVEVALAPYPQVTETELFALTFTNAEVEIDSVSYQIPGTGDTARTLTTDDAEKLAEDLGIIRTEPDQLVQDLTTKEIGPEETTGKQQIEETVAKFENFIQAGEKMLEVLGEKLKNRVVKIDPKRDIVVREAIRRVFGVDSDTITYEMFQKALKMRSALSTEGRKNIYGSR